MPIDPKQYAYYTLFSVMAFIPISNALFEISSGVFIGLALWSLLGSKRIESLRSVFFGLVLVYLFMNIVSLTQSHYPAASLRGVMKVLKNGLLCASAVTVVDSEEKFRKAFQFFLVAAFAVSLDALVQGITGFDIFRGRHMTAYHGETMRLTGPFHHANDFSAYLSLVIFLFAGTLMNGLKIFPLKRRLFFWLAFAMASLCLLWTYSRSAWFTVGTVLVCFAVFKRNKILLLVFMTAVVWGIFFSPPLVKLRVTSLGDPHGSTVERKELWLESLRMIKASPLFGLGVNTYAKNEPFYKGEGVKIDNQYAHNGYLQMAAEIGILGLASFLAAVGYFFYKSFGAFARADRVFLCAAGNALLFGILSFLVHCAMDTGLQSLLLVNTLWLSMGLAWAAKNAADAR